VAETLKTLALSVAASLADGSNKSGSGLAGPAAALERVRDFLSELTQPPPTEAERRRMTSTLHALDHATRLAEILGNGGLPGPASGGPDDLRAAELCKQVMRWTETIDESITDESALSQRAEPIGWSVSANVSATLAEVESAAKALEAMLPGHRAAILASVASGNVTAAEAFARIDAVRRLDRIAYHAWRSAAHLLGLGDRRPS
jgi:phosphate:Na+ symporter